MGYKKLAAHLPNSTIFCTISCKFSREICFLLKFPMFIRAYFYACLVQLFNLMLGLPSFYGLIRRKIRWNSCNNQFFWTQPLWRNGENKSVLYITNDAQQLWPSSCFCRDLLPPFGLLLTDIMMIFHFDSGLADPFHLRMDLGLYLSARLWNISWK